MVSAKHPRLSADLVDDILPTWSMEAISKRARAEMPDCFPAVTTISSHHFMRPFEDKDIHDENKPIFKDTLDVMLLAGSYDSSPDPDTLFLPSVYAFVYGENKTLVGYVDRNKEHQP